MVTTTVTYKFKYKFGTEGSGNGQFQDPHDVSFDSTGNCFVCDRVRNDVQKFTHEGVYISKFGGTGSGNGQFDVPYAIQHSPTGDIYVADRENNRVQRLSSSGAYISKIETINGTALNKPEDITFDKTNGDMYITDTGNNRICKLSSSHTFIREWGEKGAGNGMFDHPHSINTDAVRNVYVSSGNQPYIQKFTKDGKFIKKWGTEGTGPGQTQMFLEHMDIDVFGRVHLINNNSRPIINVWDTEGTFITQYGKTTEGGADGQFREPEHVTTDSLGQPFVVDSSNFRIQVFSVTSSEVGTGTGTGPSSTTIESADIKMFLTGGLTNTNPDLSLGGNVSTKEVISDIGNNVFRRITESEASSGVTIYRCVAIKNTDLGLGTMKSVVFYMVSDTVSVDDLALYSFAQSAKNVIETVIPNEFTAPLGTNINFKATLSRSGGIALGDLAPGEFVNVWLRVSVNPGAKQITGNKFRVRVEVNSTGTSGGGGGPVPDPNPDTGVEFKMSASSDTGTDSNATNIHKKMKARGSNMHIYNGDLSYSSSMSGWLDMTADMRSKSMVSFGNHDVDDGDGSKTTINALLSAYGIPKTYYSKIFHNVGIVVMESGENHSVAENTSSDQYKFVKSTLEGFKTNPAIEWIFVCNHYPIEGPRGAHHPNEDDTRDWYVPLFDANGVDVVITAHNHAMWRSKLLKYNSSSPNNPTVLQDGPNYSYNRATANHGKVYFDVGAGGNSHYDMGSAPSYVPFMNNKVYGYLFMEFSNNGKKCTFKFYDSSDNLLDTASITHL